jgi:hypothetical protein
MKRANLLLSTAMLLATAGVQAATANLQWSDPKEFRDIRATNDNQKRFEQRVIKELEEEFREEAAKLPEGQTLNISVKDVDLAGTIEYFYRNYPNGLRVLRNVDFPQLELSYELRDANDNVIKSGEESLADLGYRFNTLTSTDRSTFKYERALIREWYDHEFDQ